MPLCMTLPVAAYGRSIQVLSKPALTVSSGMDEAERVAGSPAESTSRDFGRPGGCVLVAPTCTRQLLPRMLIAVTHMRFLL